MLPSTIEDQTAGSSCLLGLWFFSGCFAKKQTVMALAGANSIIATSNVVNVENP